MVEVRGYQGSSIAKLENFASALEVKVSVIEMGKQYQSSSDSNLQLATSPIRSYLSGPIIIDGFSIHSERRRFLSVLERASPDAFSLYQANRMRFNNIESIKYASSDLISAIAKYPKLNTLWKSTLEIMPLNTKIYDGMTRDGKLRMVKAISASLGKIISTL